MRARLVLLSLVAALAAGCTSDKPTGGSSMPSFQNNRHVEQINSPGGIR